MASQAKEGFLCWVRFQREATATAFKTEEEMKGCRHDDIISKRGPHGEQHRRRDKKREERFFFLSIKSRRYEGPELVRDDRKGQQKGSDQSHIHLKQHDIIKLHRTQTHNHLPKK